uniref:Uncharacterized protein n=1 Tax=Psilocybe cubensis TaxID=181762 RepID=A0A8H7XM43_PSICU
MDRPVASNPHRQPRGRTVLCKCKTYCTVLNPATGLYEGEGNRISRSQRDRHTRSDRSHPESTSSANLLPMLNDSSQHLDVSSLIMRSSLELENLLSSPVIRIDQLLRFKHDPRTNGAFVFPSDNDLMLVNQGLYALADEHVNRAYLHAERELVRLISSAMVLDSDNLDVAEHLHRLWVELRNLTLLKEAEWTSQRSEGTGRPVINTSNVHVPYR